MSKTRQELKRRLAARSNKIKPPKAKKLLEKKRKLKKIEKYEKQRKADQQQQVQNWTNEGGNGNFRDKQQEYRDWIDGIDDDQYNHYKIDEEEEKALPSDATLAALKNGLIHQVGNTNEYRFEDGTPWYNVHTNCGTSNCCGNCSPAPFIPGHTVFDDKTLYDFQCNNKDCDGQECSGPLTFPGPNDKEKPLHNSFENKNGATLGAIAILLFCILVVVYYVAADHYDKHIGALDSRVVALESQNKEQKKQISGLTDMLSAHETKTKKSFGVFKLCRYHTDRNQYVCFK